MDVGVIGGSGFVGRHLIPQLGREHDVTYLSRLESDFLKSLGFEWIKADITKTENLRILKKFDLVIDLVAVINEKEQKHYDVNVKGMKNILDNVDQGTKIVYFSAMNADRGHTKYFETKFQTETMLRKRGNFLIMRPSIIYGPDDYLTQMLVSLKSPFIPRSGYLCPVFIEDIVQVLLKLLNMEGIFEISGSEKLKLINMLNTIREIRAWRKAVEIPGWLLYPVLPFLPIKREQLIMLSMDFCSGIEIWASASIKPSNYRKNMENFLKK